MGGKTYLVFWLILAMIICLHVLTYLCVLSSATEKFNFKYEFICKSIDNWWIKLDILVKFVADLNTEWSVVMFILQFDGVLEYEQNICTFGIQNIPDEKKKLYLKRNICWIRLLDCPN